MRILISIAVFIFAFSSEAFAASPEYVAQNAFKLQMQERYEQLLELYDEQSIMAVVDLFKKEFDKREPDNEMRQFLNSVLGVYDVSELKAMPPKVFMARLFAWIYSAQLTEDNRELFKLLKFELVSVDHPDPEIAIVNYNIVLPSENANFSKQKKMTLALSKGRWVVQVEPALINTLTRVFAGL